jgi:hypothetical protein
MNKKDDMNHYVTAFLREKLKNVTGKRGRSRYRDRLKVIDLTL